MTLIEKAKAFVMPFYTKKDIAHDFRHIQRVLRTARRLAERYEADDELIDLGALFHGVIHIDEKQVTDFLHAEGLPEGRIASIVQAAWDSQVGREPVLLEGKILHDAHLLEGGKTFWVVKTLILGTARGETLQETLEFYRTHRSSSRCSLPESQEEFEEKVRFTREFFDDLSENV